MPAKKKFCAYCGKPVKTGLIQEKTRDYCPACGAVFYENPLPVACCIVANTEREILLVKRGRDPYKDMWCLPIGFAESGEDIKDAALRELREESGMEGEIIRLIDVDTVDNYFYGSLAIVTYETRISGGELRPGDDALDAAFFPLDSLPELAWTSNKKAVDLFISLNADIWKMTDSLHRLFPEEIISGGDSSPVSDEFFISRILYATIEKYSGKITDSWKNEVSRRMTQLTKHAQELEEFHLEILKGIQAWINRSSAAFSADVFIEFGKRLSAAGISLPDMLIITALSRKSLWKYFSSEKALLSPMDIFTALEINNRIIFFYDKINYFVTKGYFS